MDSYTSNPPGTHSGVTSPEASEGRDWLTAKVLSPASFGPAPGSDDSVPALDIGRRSDDADQDRRHVRQRKDTDAKGEGRIAPRKGEDRSVSTQEKKEAAAPVSQARDRFKGLLGIDTGSQQPSSAGPAEPETRETPLVMDSPVEDGTDGFQMIESPIEDYTQAAPEKDDAAGVALVDSPTEEDAGQWQTVDSPIEDHGAEPALVDSPSSEHVNDASRAALVASPVKEVEELSLVDSPVEEQDNQDLASKK